MPRESLPDLPGQLATRHPPAGPGSDGTASRAAMSRHRGRPPSTRPGSAAGGPPLPSGIDGTPIRPGSRRRFVRPVAAPPPATARLPRPIVVRSGGTAVPQRRSTAARTERVDARSGAGHARSPGRTAPYGISPASTPRDALRPAARRIRRAGPEAEVRVRCAGHAVGPRYRCRQSPAVHARPGRQSLGVRHPGEAPGTGAEAVPARPRRPDTASPVPVPAAQRKNSRRKRTRPLSSRRWAISGSTIPGRSGESSTVRVSGSRRR